PPSGERPRPARRALVAAVAALSLYAAFVAGAWFLNGSELQKLNRTIEELRGRKLQLQKQAAAVKAPAVKKADGAEAEIVGMMRATPPWEAILSELSIVVPEGVWLELIQSGGERHLRVKGYSKNQSDIARLIDSLERSDLFGGIELVYSRKGEKATSFELRAELTWT
ncbi:MAG: PilN domain-containing protein, partial [Nitrospirota bacterium]